MFLEGQRAPDFKLQGSDGKQHTLKDYAGKLLILYFYPRDNTPGCTSEAVGFSKLQPLFEQLGALLVGVSKDSLKSHEKFIADFKIPFTLLSDPDASAMKASPSVTLRPTPSDNWPPCSHPMNATGSQAL